MRDIEVIDSELRLLVAIRQMVTLVEGQPPSTAPHRRVARRAGKSGALSARELIGSTRRSWPETSALACTATTHQALPDTPSM
jgi:hypothetical protein